MPTLETIAKWLKDSAGKIVVPKTLTSCVLDSNGKTVDERLEECENGNIFTIIQIDYFHYNCYFNDILSAKSIKGLQNAINHFC